MRPTAKDVLLQARNGLLAAFSGERGHRRAEAVPAKHSSATQTALRAIAVCKVGWMVEGRQPFPFHGGKASRASELNLGRETGRRTWNNNVFIQL